MYRPYSERTIHGDGEQKLYRFDNNYGASVVRHSFSYGSEEGLWELAVLIFDTGANWNLTYDTPVTSDVLGHLTNDDVEATLAKIEALPNASEA